MKIPKKSFDLLYVVLTGLENLEKMKIIIEKKKFRDFRFASGESSERTRLDLLVDIIDTSEIIARNFNSLIFLFDKND